MKKYIKIARPDHWIKQLFVFPGCMFAFLLAGTAGNAGEIFLRIVLGFFSTCFIASSNYVINEWLDAEFDKYHPTKKYRSVVQEDVKGYIVYTEYAILTVSSHHDDVEGVKGVCLSLPTVIGKRGIHSVIYPKLSEEEHKLLKESAEKIKEYSDQAIEIVSKNA